MGFFAFSRTTAPLQFDCIHVQRPDLSMSESARDPHVPLHGCHLPSSRSQPIPLRSLATELIIMGARNLSGVKDPQRSLNLAPLK